MNPKNKTAVGIILLVFIFFVILVIFANYTVKSLDDTSSSLGLGDSKPTIAVIEIEETIMESKKIVERLLKAEKASNVKAIILRINSPGGAVGPVQEIYDEVVRIDEKIPVYASFGVIAASGGYYIGAAAREIYASAGSLTGSIGVIMQFMDFSELVKLAKVKDETVKAGRYKDIGSPTRPMRDEERDLLSSSMKKVHQQFINDIQKRRKEKIKGDIKELAQGQVFSGQEALEVGLIDKLGSLWKLGRDIYTAQGMEGEPEYWYVKEKKKVNFMEMLQSMEEAFTPLRWKMMVEKLPMLLYQ